jgi:5-methylcytosine-specific restriction endonuclease McrA
MRPRRFSARGSTGQAQRRATWQHYGEDRRWWDRRREWLASGAANTRCPGCGTEVGSRDDVHHLAYPDTPGTERDEDLVLLCRACHDVVHDSIDASVHLRRMNRRLATWTVLNTLYRSRYPLIHHTSA